jgi:hypothetical protein
MIRRGVFVTRRLSFDEEGVSKRVKGYYSCTLDVSFMYLACILDVSSMYL